MNSSHTFLSPAKINLSLSVKEYSESEKKHELESEMLKISLADEITIEVTEKKKIQIIVKGEYSKGVPNNSENIVHKAVTQFFSRRPRNIGLKITLTKNIPNGAGLGGGSSNAAEVLKFLHEYYSVPLVLAEYAALGSDIPFFLEKHVLANVSGFGEKIEKKEVSDSLLQKHKFGVLFLFPAFPLSTAWAFSQLKYNRENNRESEKNSDTKKKTNDFQSLVFSHFYDIEKVFMTLQHCEPICSGLTGSGSSLFAFFETEEKQKKVLDNFNESVGFSLIN